RPTDGRVAHVDACWPVVAEAVHGELEWVALAIHVVAHDANGIANKRVLDGLTSKSLLHLHVQEHRPRGRTLSNDSVVGKAQSWNLANLASPHAQFTCAIAHLHVRLQLRLAARGQVGLEVVNLLA